jgi:hypothetical protein
MPEGANPGLDKSSADNFHYFTLPMALNYRRAAYQLWEAALATFQDPATRFVFRPEQVVATSEDVLRSALSKYRLALQPIQHVKTWMTICATLVNCYQGDVRALLASNDYDIPCILDQIQHKHKEGFPRLCGPKISNYWLYVLLDYTSAPLKDRCCLSIAPDTHVIQASLRLGIVVPSDMREGGLPSQVAHAWEELLAGTGICPIDLHHPLWLWSRNGYKPPVYSVR